MLFAFDANSIIHAFRRRGRVAEKLSKLEREQIAIPAIALYEVRRGVMAGQNSELRSNQLDVLSKSCRILPFDRDVAEQAARIRFDLEQRGLIIGPLDLLIAATAMVFNAVLVTHNTRELKRVRGLRIEDWY